MVSGVCSKPAASVLHSVTKDGCYTREEAYRFLSILSGAYVDDPSQSEAYLQSRLTAAWIRGKDEIDNGFCVDSVGSERVFTAGSKPGSQVLFTSQTKS
jgi:hypothetical protein